MQQNFEFLNFEPVNGYVFYNDGKSAIIKSADIFPLEATIGTPPPGWVDAPTRYSPLTLFDLLAGRKTMDEAISFCKAYTAP